MVVCGMRAGMGRVVVLAGLTATVGGCGSAALDENQAKTTPAAQSVEATAEPSVSTPENEPATADVSSPAEQPSETTTTADPPSKPAAQADKVVVLSPEEFKAEFEDSGSNRRKAGVVLQVDGTVTGVHTSFGDQPFVTLKTRGDDPDLGTPYYTVDRQPWATLAPGQQVTLQGRWDGALGWIFDIAKSGPNPAPMMKAEALVKEFTTDREATDRKYRDKTLYVTGKVAQKAEDAAVSVLLEGRDGVNVLCSITGFDKALAEPIKVGQTVTLCGEYFPGLSEDGPSLAICRPIKSFKPTQEPKDDQTTTGTAENASPPLASASPKKSKPAEAARGTTDKTSAAEVQPEWQSVAKRLQARRDVEGATKKAVPFTGPPGNGRRGANGLFVPSSAAAGAGASAWRFAWEWDDTARGVHVVHPFRTGHVLVLLYRDYAAVFPGGDWPHDEYLGKSSFPVQNSESFGKAFPIPAEKPVKIVSRLEPDGLYTLNVDNREVLTATIDTVEPLRLPESFKGEKLPATWPAGSAGMIIGPVDTGFNRATGIELLISVGDDALADYRQPLPDDQAQQAARKAIRELLADDYSKARDAESKRKLAQKLHELAIETRRDPDARFVMLQEAGDLAVESMDVKRLLAVVEALDGQFAIDGTQRLKESLERMARQVASSKEGKPIAEHALALSDWAEKRDAFDDAQTFATIASIAATRMRDDGLLETIRDRRRELDALAVRFAGAAAAREVLKEKPDDPAANQVLGSYLLFVRGNWREGLPLLAKSDDEQLQALARRELANIRTPDELVALGDAWLKLSESRTGREQDDYQARAAAWYRQALDKITGLTRERVRKRLEELREKASKD